MEEIVLFTTHCPKCKVLEKKLKDSGLAFRVEEDQAKILEVAQRHNITMAPFLLHGDTVLNFSEAVKWVNEKNRHHK